MWNNLSFVAGSRCAASRSRPPPLRPEWMRSHGHRPSCVSTPVVGIQRGFTASPLTSPTKPTASGRRSRPLRSAARYALWLPVAMFFVQHVYSVARIEGQSMLPTMNAPPPGSLQGVQDIVILNRWVVADHSLKIGDVVTLLSPIDPKLTLTKRILALPGDVVHVHLPAKATRAFPSASPERHPGGILRLRVPPGHAWVEGDASTLEAAEASLPGAYDGHGVPSSAHRGRGATRSRDSREFGPVPLGLITSRVDYIVWPPSHFGAPKPRPGFDAARAREQRVRRDDLVRMGVGLAHPEDSSISPYLDWTEAPIPDEGPRQGAEGGGGEGEPVDLAMVRGGGGGRSPRRRKELAGRRAEESDEVEALVKAYWNQMSRGGTLGDDAQDD